MKDKNRKNPKINRRKLIDALTVVLCLCGAGAAFFLFWRDLNATLTKQNETPVASISFKYNIAQRRFGDRLAWDLLKQDSALYSGDVIHTAELAEATIFFSDDDASVSMSENTLAQIFVTNQGKRIELSSGAVSVNAGVEGVKLVLVSSGTEVDIDSGSIVSANAGGGAGVGGVQVVKGMANIITTDGRVEAGEGSSLFINAEGQTIISAAVSMLNPAPSSHYLLDGSEMPVYFSWDTVNFSASDFVRFQIAADQRFNTLIESVDVRNARTQTYPLKPGVYWWRAFAIGADTSEQPIPAISNKFTIIAVKKPDAVTPELNGEITYRSVPPSVRFQWTVDDNAEVNEYMLQVANNTQFQTPALTTQVRGDSYLYGGLNEGTWYWQVRPVYPNDWIGAQSVSFSAVSNIASFSIRQTSAMLDAPVLRLPAEAAFIDISPNAGDILFSWKNTDDAVSYTLEIADNMSFENPRFTRTVNTNRCLVSPSKTPLNSGTNFWRVSYADGAGNLSPPSAPSHFTAVETLIVFESVYPPDNYNVNDTSFGDIRFQWKSNLEASSHFQFARDSSFSSLLIDEITTGTEFQAAKRLGRLNEGTYFWRVISSFNGRGLESAVRRLTIRTSPRITLEAPPENAVIDGLSALRGLASVRWSSTEPPANSRLLVLRDGEPAFELDNPARVVMLPSLSPGAYTWTVQAETSSGFDISPEAPFRFTVEAIPRLPAPTGLRPAAGYNFGPEELRQISEIRFTWNAVQGANGYIFRLYHEYDAARSRPVVSSAVLRGTSYTISDLTILDAGAMIWRTEAVFTSPDGSIEQRGIPAESRFSINIKLPNAPVLPDEETYGR
jgi:hypothetical protein